MSLPRFSRYSQFVDDTPRNLIYCGHCLSHNMIIYDGRGTWDTVIYDDDKIECLDCGFKGETKDHKLMSKKHHDKIIFNVNRINKINKIKERICGVITVEKQR